MRVLLAVDGSECSQRAAAFLSLFDLTSRDEITILHVISEIPYDDDSLSNIRRIMKRVAPRILESSAGILKSAGARIFKREEEGYPDVTIMEIAEEVDAGLIVLGTRGIRGIKSLFIGSTARSVAINSARPVLVTRSPQWSLSGSMKVLLAVDGSPSSNATAALLDSMPFPPDAELKMLHVRRPALSDIPDEFVREIHELTPEERSKFSKRENEKAKIIMDQARARLARKFSHMQESIQTGDPSMEILKDAEGFHADIIAVGCRGLKGFKGMMGSVSRRMLGHSPCSVLIGKAGQVQSRQHSETGDTAEAGPE